MKRVVDLVWKWRVWKDILREDHGQDLIEYALMAGFVAVAAGTLMPGMIQSISGLFVKIQSVITQAGS